MRRPISLLLFALVAVSAVTPAMADGHASAMQQSLQRFFARGIEHQGARAELIRVVRWPEAHGAMHWRLPHIGQQHPSRLSLIAEQGAGRHLRRWYVPVRVHWWTKAVVATRDIPARAHITPSMLGVARIDVAGIHGIWWQDPSSLANTRSTRPMHAGMPILSSYIIRPPLLRTGDEVTLVSRIGGVQVTATGKVLRTAGAGDRVRVENLRSKQIVQATIIDAHTARVATGGAS